MEYKWYDDVPANSSIEQGDIVENCNILVPNEQHYQAFIPKLCPVFHAGRITCRYS